MALTTEKIADLRVKHLEMLQTVVARMANHCATAKSYCITLTTGVCGFAVSQEAPQLALLALMPIVFCGLVDARYLQLERRFRAAFDHVRREAFDKMPTFEIGTSYGWKGYLGVLFSWSILFFYAPLIAAVPILWRVLS